MGKTAILAVRIISDAKDASAGFDQATSRLDRFQSGVATAAKVAAGLTAAMATVGAMCINAASDAQQAAGAVESVFGPAAAEVEKFAGAAAQSVGLASSQYNNLAAVLGAQLKNLGIAQDQIAGTTNNLITLGADLAATFGGTTAEAVQALSGVFRGEFDPIERYGVSIKQSDINARLAAQGMTGLTGEALKQAQAQAALAMITEQTAGAQGQFARESNTLAGQQQRMNAELENAKAQLGQALLPMFAKLAQILASVAEFVGRNAQAFTIIAVVVGSAAAILTVLNAALSAYKIISGVITAVNGIQAASWFATAAAEMAALWPLALIVLAIAAVIAIVVLVIKNLDTLRNWWDIAFEAGRTAVGWVWDKLQALGNFIAGVFNAAVRTVGDVFSSAMGIARAAVGALLAPINAVISAVRSLIGWISKIRFPSIPNLNPFKAALPQQMSVPQLPGAAPLVHGPSLAALTVGGGVRVPAPQITNISITVNGALDPVQTGKQIADAVQSSTRSRGLTNAVRLSTDRRVI
ncbi:hypothetical protein [Nocardia wallacei]|uniref:hypothetical protein n=1 Tax=Nocardia wallacei TaxID=480035 RepID=UPI002456BF58|nr:hypothetical protein [Nocardia wallacei]